MGSATAWARRTYSGAAPRAELATGIDGTSVSFVVDNGAGFPATGPFFVVIDRDSPSEEKIEVASRSSGTFAINSVTQRGVDGTSAVSHQAGAPVEHCLTATDMDEANAASHYTIGQITTKGDLIAGTGAKAATRVPVGSNGTVLLAASGEAGGVGFGQVASAGIANGAVGPTKLASDAVETAKIDDDAVTAPKIEVSQRWEPGDIKISARATPSTGWLACDGTAVSRSTHSALFSAIGTTFGAGDGSTTFNLPGAEDAFLIGAGGSFALGVTGGAATHALASAELPAHAHAVSLTSGNQSQSHSHAAGSLATASNGSHAHTIDGDGGDRIQITHANTSLSNPSQAQSPGLGVVHSRIDAAGAHTHTIGGSTGNASQDHTHSVSGNTGNGPGSATPFSILPPYVGVNVLIKT